MAKADENKKLRIGSFRIIIIFIGLFIVMEAIFYISFQSQQFWPLETSFYIYTPVLLVLSIVFCYISLHSTYYMIDKHKLTHSKMGQIKEYYWKDIVFVDEEWTKKHKMMLFFTNDGLERYLMLDKQGLIFEYALKYGRLMSREEFIKRFPKAKL